MCTTAGSITPAVTAAQQAGRQLTIPLEPVGAVTITTLVDNVTDLLAMDAGPARRPFIGDAVRGSSPLFEGGWLRGADRRARLLGAGHGGTRRHRAPDLVRCRAEPGRAGHQHAPTGPGPGRCGDHRPQPRALRPHHRPGRLHPRRGAQRVFADRFPAAFIPNTVGTRFEL